MGYSLLEDHGAGKGAGAKQGHLFRLHPEGGGHPGKTRQLAFLIGDVPAAVSEFHESLGIQPDDLRLLAGVGLPALDGQNDWYAHSTSSTAS